ncbi:aldo/keto reductase [Microbacterium aerolatum]|uniref:aldo/keto reductase n=1 Tax=Microbacterium aerolatum TaxID=153731 RepID=UPI002000E5B0|nr:aldo/keto reductase [Microbacterium aerolatum]MCK3771146.1 aldo/keto reductase [Microbacterium aerolatum]
MTTSTITLNNGVEIPAIGLGVFQTPPEETVAAVATALRTGYRHIDTAAAYGNEKEVGQGIRESGVPHEDIFIESKVWISDYGYDETLHAFEKSAAKLGVEQIDLFILHQALPSEFDKTIAAYKALEQLLADRKVRAIGVSNFMPEHLTPLLEQTDVVPAVNQIELHPYFQQKELVALHRKHGVTTQAWSPIGGITSYRESAKRSFDEPVILTIGEKYGKSAAQVMLRWHIQNGVQVIPKSTKAHRIEENFDVFDFELTADEVAQIDALDTGVRGGPEPDVITLENFGKPIPEA